MIKRILADVGEECEVDVEELHDKVISQLPAEKYLDLFHKMQTKIYGFPTYTAWNGGCNCGTIEDNAEDNAKYYDKQPAKVEKSYAVGSSGKLE